MKKTIDQNQIKIELNKINFEIQSIVYSQKYNPDDEHRLDMLLINRTAYRKMLLKIIEQ